MVTRRREDRARQRLLAWLVPGTPLYVAKTDGSELWKVPNTEDAYDPAWRPQ
jgi:hypothetical protein